MLRPSQPWELIQLGGCSSPIETAEGWLVITHGVGPMRTYGLGAVLLDLGDPSIVLGALTEPLMTPGPEEREGYVPNVLYSCGGLIHGETVVLPYGCSDSVDTVCLHRPPGPARPAPRPGSQQARIRGLTSESEARRLIPATHALPALHKPSESS